VSAPPPPNPIIPATESCKALKVPKCLARHEGARGNYILSPSSFCSTMLMPGSLKKGTEWYHQNGRKFQTS
jgi:hypothetical protein